MCWAEAVNHVAVEERAVVREAVEDRVAVEEGMVVEERVVAVSVPRVWRQCV